MKLLNSSSDDSPRRHLPSEFHPRTFHVWLYRYLTILVRKLGRLYCRWFYKAPIHNPEFHRRYQAGERNFRRLRFIEVDLRDIDCSRLNLQGADLRFVINLRKARLQGANFTQVDLRGLDLSGTDLSQTCCVRANLAGANLSSACLAGAVLSWAVLEHSNCASAIFSEANLSRARLQWSNLSNAVFEQANLSWADLRWANLTWADLSSAELSRAYLSHSDFSCTYFKDANLAQVQVGGVGDDTARRAIDASFWQVLLGNYSRAANRG